MVVPKKLVVATDIRDMACTMIDLHRDPRLQIVRLQTARFLSSTVRNGWAFPKVSERL